MKQVSPLFGSIAFTFAMASSLEAASETHNRNWPQWRGPAGNGLVLHGDPPTEWSETKNIKWKVAIPGKGHATPAIWDNRIFVMTAVPSEDPAPAAAPTPAAEPQGGNRQRGRGGRGGRGGPPPAPHAFTVLCLDKATGKTLWQTVARTEAPQPVQPSNTYSSGSPITDGERVYAYFGSHGLYCYDMDGKPVWNKDLGKVNVTFGEGSSPALHGDVLVVVQDNNADSFVYAFNKKTGQELWKKSRDEGSGWTTPYFLEHGGKTQVVINGSNAVRSYDLQTGELLWQCSGLGSNPVPSLVSDDQTVYAMSGHRNGAALAIKLGGSGDITPTAVRWTITRGTPYVPSPLLYDGLLYFCQRTSPILSCVDAASGEAHFAEERIEGLSGVYASPIGVQNRIYLAGQNGTTVVLEKSKELKVLASNPLDDGFDASPAVVGNELFLRGRSNLYCIAAMQ